MKPRLSSILNRFIKKYNMDIIIYMLQISNNKASDYQVYSVLSRLSLLGYDEFVDANNNYIIFSDLDNKKAFVSYNFNTNEYEIRT